MRTFLGLIMVLIVSDLTTFAFVDQSDCETVSSILHGSVLLPCSCPERRVDEPLYWQMESPDKTSMLTYNNSNTTSKGRYEGRVKIFLPEDGNNCSVLLTNITPDDQGKYRCSFKNQILYNKIFVNLNVFASYHVCQKNFTECHAKGLYRDAEIEWNQDGRPLTNSSTTDITLDDSTGLYHFTSKLNTSPNGTSGLTCTVKAKVISTTIIDDCKSVKDEIRQIRDKTPLRYRCLKIIPIMVILGFFLVLWRRLRFLESMPTTRQRETGNCYCET